MLARDNRNVRIVRADLHDRSDLQLAAAIVTDATGGSLDVFVHVANWATTTTAAAVDDATLLTSRALETADAEQTLKAALDETVDRNVWLLIRQLGTFVPLLQRGGLKKVVVLNSALADLDALCRTGVSRSLTLAMSRAAVGVILMQFAAEYKGDGLTFLALNTSWANISRNL